MRMCFIKFIELNNDIFLSKNKKKVLNFKFIVNFYYCNFCFK